LLARPFLTAEKHGRNFNPINLSSSNPNIYVSANVQKPRHASQSHRSGSGD
jgi:hypothetical protein